MTAACSFMTRTGASAPRLSPATPSLAAWRPLRCTCWTWTQVLCELLQPEGVVATRVCDFLSDVVRSCAGPGSLPPHPLSPDGDLDMVAANPGIYVYENILCYAGRYGSAGGKPCTDW
jgi:hypothetical protein